ncbi:MAG: BatA domain-containing protein, partial [bacterium]
MTFLNPLFLFGLLAASIPIIIHLLNLRKLKVIEFSSLQFLKELQKTKMRRVKIRQWLLLALRTMLIIAVVMAFSRPALRGSLSGLAGFPLGGSTHARTTLVLLLDDSPSMTVRNERGEFFTQAKEAASHILDLMKDGDEAYLIKLSDVKQSAEWTPSHAAAPLKKSLEQLNCSQQTAPFRDALGIAAKLLSESKNFNQEVYLITDAQATQFKSAADSSDLFDDKVKLFLADVRTGSSNEIENAGITSAEVTSKLITYGKPVTLEASVRNSGSSAIRNSVVSVYLDGARVVQHSVDVGAHSSASTRLIISPKRRGILHGYVHLEDDAFEQDNTRYFAMNVPNRIRVLSVGPSSNEIRLAALALTLDKDSGAAGLFSVDQIPETQLSLSRAIELRRLQTWKSARESDRGLPNVQQLTPGVISFRTIEPAAGARAPRPSRSTPEPRV